MAESTDIQLCDAIVADLAEQFPTTSPRRVHVPAWTKATDLKTLRIEVNPGSQPTEIPESDNDGLFVAWNVLVSIAITVTRGTAQTLDDLLDQVEEIRKHLQQSQYTLDNDAELHCQSFEYATRMDPGLMNRETVAGAEVYSGTFLAVLLFPFREVT